MSSATAAQPVLVGIVRDPPETVVIIDNIRIPQNRDNVVLERGPHILVTAIAGQSGDTGTGVVKEGAVVRATATARIPEGLKEAFSAETPFNV